MIKAEEYIHRTPSWLKRISESRFNLDIDKLERVPNGAWFAVVTIAVDVKMRDGRTVKGSKQIRLRCLQDGRRPNPAAFGKKRKR